MLTNAAAKAAGAQPRAYKLHDQGGLHLLVRPTGTKSWQLKYRWRGREKLLTIGQFPAINVNAARLRAVEAKEELEQNREPAPAGKLDTFEQVARAWHQVHAVRWSKAHAGDVIASLERDVFPAIGGSEIADIGAAELVRLIEIIETSGRIETARRVRQRLRQVFAFAKTRELVTTNPAAELGAASAGVTLPTPHRALTTIEDCRALLAACEEVPARPATRLAHRFLALTGTRLAAVRGARWKEIEGLDGPAPVWRVPAARMKLAKVKKGDARFDHLVPLSPAAVAVLREAISFSTTIEAANLIFSTGGFAPIGEGAIRQLVARTQFADRHVPHGWRASFSTLLNEQLGEGWRTDIDRALAHAGMGKVEAAYNRSQQLERRRTVLERWGGLLAG
jgi:integrase